MLLRAPIAVMFQEMTLEVKGTNGGWVAVAWDGNFAPGTDMRVVFSKSNLNFLADAPLLLVFNSNEEPIHSDRGHTLFTGATWGFIFQAPFEPDKYKVQVDYPSGIWGGRLKVTRYFNVVGESEAQPDPSPPRNKGFTEILEDVKETSTGLGFGALAIAGAVLAIMLASKKR